MMDGPSLGHFHFHPEPKGGLCTCLPTTGARPASLGLSQPKAHPEGQCDSGRVWKWLWKRGQDGFMTGSGTSGRAVQGAS